LTRDSLCIMEAMDPLFAGVQLKVAPKVAL
jgi:hypothetical protein